MRGLGSSDVVKQLPPPVRVVVGWVRSVGGPVARWPCQLLVRVPCPLWWGGGIGLLGLRWVLSAVEEKGSVQKDQVVGCRP